MRWCDEQACGWRTSRSVLGVRLFLWLHAPHPAGQAQASLPVVRDQVQGEVQFVASFAPVAHAPVPHVPHPRKGCSTTARTDAIIVLSRLSRGGRSFCPVCLLNAMTHVAARPGSLSTHPPARHPRSFARPCTPPFGAFLHAA